MAIQLAGLSYAAQPIKTFAAKELSAATNLLTQDQAKFNFIYTVFYDEIERGGLKAVKDKYANSCGQLVREEMREALYLPPLPFSRIWARNAFYQATLNFLIENEWMPADTNKRIKRNARTIHIQMFGSEKANSARIISLAEYRARRVA